MLGGRGGSRIYNSDVKNSEIAELLGRSQEFRILRSVELNLSPNLERDMDHPR